MGRCEGQAAVRDENREIVRDADGKPLLKPCPSWAVRGSNPPRCIIHLGGEDVRKRRAQKEEAYVRKHWGELQGLISGMDIPDLNPMDALLDVVRHTGAMMRVLQLLVGELEVEPDLEVTLAPDGELVKTVKAGLWGPDHNGEQAPHVMVNLLGIWTDRHTRACKMALDAGVDERMVRNAEATAATLQQAFTLALRAVALPEDTRSALTRAFALELRQAITPAHDVASRVADG